MAAGAIVAAVVEFALLHSAAGVDLAVRSANSTRQITVAAVIVAAAVAALAGWALLAVLERPPTAPASGGPRSRSPSCCCRSLVGPPSGVGGGAKATLALLHLSVGVILILGLPRPRPEGANR